MGIMRSHPPHLERLGIHRPGFRTLPIMPPKHVWMVSGMRDLPWMWRLARARRCLPPKLSSATTKTSG